MKAVGRFVVCFLLLFGGLAWPWRGLHQAVSSGFRAETVWLAGVVFPNRTFRAQPLEDARYPTVDSELIARAPGKVTPEERRAVRIIAFDSRSQGWIPLAMLIALAAATPLPWSKRFPALLVGMLLVQLLIAATLLVSITCDLSDDLMPGGGHWLLFFANHLLAENLWFSVVPPFLLWAGWLAASGHWKSLNARLAGS
jgi:hypothetical protein